MDKVTDSALLAMLESGPAQKVTDPDLLAQLDAPEYPYEAPPFMARVGRGFMDVGQGAKELALRATDWMEDTDRAGRYRERVNDELALYDRGHEAGGGGVDWGRALGNAAAAAPLGAGVALPATLGGRMALGGALGGAAGAVEYSEDGDRTGNALAGGVVGGGVPVLGNALRRAVTGLRPGSPEAAQMLREGVPLTPGQKAGGAVQSMEQVLSRAPFSGPAVRASQTDALAAWNRNLMDGVRPGQQRIGAAGSEGMQQLTKQFDDAYDALLDQPITLRDGRQMASGRPINDMQKRMRDSAFDALRTRDSEQAAYLFAERDKLLNQLPDDVLAGLRQLDAAYPAFAALRQVVGSTAVQKQAGVFTPGQLQMASRAVDRSAGKGATARGTAPMQPAAQTGMRVFGTAAAPPASVLERAALAPLGLAARPFYGRGAQAWARGDYGWQQTADAMTDTNALIRALRRHASPSIATTSTQPEGFDE